MMDNKTRSLLCGILMFLTYTGFAAAQCLNIPDVDGNTNITCDMMTCNITCIDGYELGSNDNSSIDCPCPDEMETTTFVDISTTMMMGGPDRMSDSNCTWNASSLPQCVPTTTGTPEVLQTTTFETQTTKEQATKPEKYIGWKEYWISTGLLIFFVVVLLVATTFLLWATVWSTTNRINSRNVGNNNFNSPDELIDVHRMTPGGNNFLYQYCRGRSQTPPSPVAKRSHTNPAFETENFDEIQHQKKSNGRDQMNNFTETQRQANSYAQQPNHTSHPRNDRSAPNPPYPPRPTHQHRPPYNEPQNEYDDSMNFDGSAPQLPPPNLNAQYPDYETPAHFQEQDDIIYQN